MYTCLSFFYSIFDLSIVVAGPVRSFETPSIKKRSDKQAKSLFDSSMKEGNLTPSK